MEVKNVMLPNPPSVTPYDGLETARQMMLWSDCRYLPVVLDGRLLGVLSEHDILRCRACIGDVADTTVEQAMTTPPQTTHPSESVDLAALRMTDGGIGCLPVLERGRLVGMLTSTDLLAAEAKRSLETPKPVTSMFVDELMTRQIKTVRPSDSLLTVIQTMATHKIRHVPVVDEHGKLVGLISDRDVRGHRQSADPSNTSAPRTTRAESMMTRNVATVTAHEPVDSVVAAFADWRLSALPVVNEDNEPIGIVSYVDVLHALAASTPTYDHRVGARA